MKKISILTVLLSLLLIGVTGFSQPKATVQMIIGYSLPMPDLKGNFGETRNTFTGNGNPDSNTYFMKSGLNYGLQIKLPLGRKSNINFTGGIVFNVFKNSTDYSDSIDNVNINLKQSILSINLGGEYTFSTKKSTVNPYIGVGLSLNFITGKYTEEYINSTNTLNLNSAFRVGLLADAGVDLVLHNNVGILIGAKYGIANLIGKSYEEDTQTRYNLNDAEYTNSSGTYKAKSISFLQLYSGVSFYFGR
jgi:hypothetical protein